MCSLRPISLSPDISNLDLPRIETMPNGDKLERTTRTWVSSLLLSNGSHARCDVVNGMRDHQTLIFVPAQHLSEIQDSVRAYRLRLNTLGQRETQFRDGISGLPTEIQFDPSTQANLTFLEHLSSEDIWNQAPPAVRGLSVSNPPPPNLNAPIPVHPTAIHPGKTETLWPPPGVNRSHSSQSTQATNESEAMSLHKGKRHSTQVSQTDDTTAVSTQSDSTVMRTILARLNHLDAMLKAQQLELSQVSTLTQERLQQAETRLKRLDTLDDTIIQRMNIHQAESMSVLKNQFADMIDPRETPASRDSTQTS